MTSDVVGRMWTITQQASHRLVKWLQIPGPTTGKGRLMTPDGRHYQTAIAE